MDTVNHLNEAQLREELIRSQDTLAELQTTLSSIRAKNDQLMDGLNSFVEGVLGPALSASSSFSTLERSKLKQIIRELVREELSEATIDTDNLALDIDIESYTNNASVTGKAYIVLPD